MSTYRRSHLGKRRSSRRMKKSTKTRRHQHRNKKYSKRNRYNNYRGGESVDSEYTRLFPGMAPKTSGFEFSGLIPELLLSGNVDAGLADKFKQRKYYEMRVWNICKDAVKSKIVNGVYYAPIIAFFKSYLTKLAMEINKHTNAEKFYNFMKKIYASKTTGNNRIYLSGMIDFNAFTSKLIEICKDATNKNEETRSVVDTYCSNIRDLLTTIDFIVKTLEKSVEYSSDSPSTVVSRHNSSAVMPYLIETFDNCVRTRDGRTKNKSPETIIKLKDSLFCLEDHTHTFAGDKIAPEGSCADVSSKPQEGEDDRNHGILEPYDDIEKQFLENYYKTDNETDFVPGINLFYQEKVARDTIDVFCAGISGHTAEISLMFRLFTMPSSIAEFDKYVHMIIATSCLIWMLDYYHHSFREILMASCIHFSEYFDSEFLNKLVNLYRKVTPTDSLENIKNEIEEEILGKLLQSSNESTLTSIAENITIDAEMVKFMLDTKTNEPYPSLSTRLGPKLNALLANIEGFPQRVKDIIASSTLPEDVKPVVTFPLPETCTGARNHVLESYKDFYVTNSIFQSTASAAQ
jgi:hypothetical protein